MTQSGDVVGVSLDLKAGTLSFYVNGRHLGTAFENLEPELLFPALELKSSFTRACVNFGQDPFVTAPIPASSAIVGNEEAWTRRLAEFARNHEQRERAIREELERSQLAEEAKTRMRLEAARELKSMLPDASDEQLARALEIHGANRAAAGTYVLLWRNNTDGGGKRGRRQRAAHDELDLQPGRSSRRCGEPARARVGQQARAQAACQDDQGRCLTVPARPRSD